MPHTENIISLRQERAAAVASMEQLQKTSETEGRTLSRDERRKFDRSDAECRRLTEAIDRLERLRNLDGSTSRLSSSDLDGNARGGREAEFRSWLAGELRDMASGTFGGALVPLDYQEVVWDRLRPASVFLSTGPTVIETTRHTISLPSLTADAAASWVSEAGAIGETDPTGATITCTPSKVAALTKISREAADDSNPGVADVVMKNLMQSIGLAVDAAAFQGTGSSNQPVGLKSTSGIVLDSTTMGANGSVFGSLDPILSALGTLEGNNADMSKAVIVMHSRSWNEITKLKDSQNRYLLSAVQSGGAPARSIDGVPVFVSNQLSIAETQGTNSDASSVYVYDSSQVICVRREALRLEATKDAFFSNDQIGIRGIGRFGFCVPNPLAVVRLAGVR